MLTECLLSSNSCSPWSYLFSGFVFGVKSVGVFGLFLVCFIVAVCLLCRYLVGVLGVAYLVVLVDGVC